MEIEFFDQSVKDFVEGLEEKTYAKTLRTLDLLAQFGSRLGMPHSKKISRGLFELRICGRREVRILYSFVDGAIMLLVGFVKKSQWIPRRWIDLAKKRLNFLDYI